MKVLLKLVESIQSEKQTLKEKSLAVYRELKMVVARFKQMEETQLKSITSELERLLKSSFENGLLIQNIILSEKPDLKAEQGLLALKAPFAVTPP